MALDPLDGSSNIDVNISIGTIFSIYRRVSRVGGSARAEDFVQAGGLAVTGPTNVLDVPPSKHLHQRAPFFVGSAELGREFQAAAE